MPAHADRFARLLRLTLALVAVFGMAVMFSGDLIEELCGHYCEHHAEEAGDHCGDCTHCMPTTHLMTMSSGVTQAQDAPPVRLIACDGCSGETILATDIDRPPRRYS